MRQRNSIVPQMTEYDALGSVWRPYLMYFHAPNYTSKAVNTDTEGFRFSTFKSQRVSPTSLVADREHHVLVGGSTAFGVGAESDDATIASHLARATQSPWLNMAGRAFSSVQEYLVFAAYQADLPRLGTVVILSGFNNLFLAQRSLSFDPPLGSFFYQQAFQTGMDAGTQGRRKLLKRALFGTPTSAPRQQRDLAEAVRLAVALTRRSLQLWSFIAKARGLKLVYALQPTAHWLGRTTHPKEAQLFGLLERIDPALTTTLSKLDNACYEQYREQLAAACTEVGVTFIDVNELLRSQNSASEWWHVDRVHYAGVGNRRIADALAQNL
ncbi:MAG: hypothetical protein EBY95_03985 [Actinobacteria bacterium]|nr:hypothetical protein [Actinomycetota bacterium]